MCIRDRAYPARGQLDVVLPGQEDEATPDPDGVPWEPDRPEEDGGESSTDEDCEPRGGKASACGDEAAEWDEFPPEVPDDHRGDGDVQEAAAVASARPEIPREDLSVDQSNTLLRHCGRVQALKQASDIFETIGGMMGASLRNTVARVLHRESKGFREQLRGDAAVAAELRATAEAEEALQRKRRAEFQEQMQQRREKLRIERELKEAQTDLRKARKDLKDIDAVVTAKEACKAYALEALGWNKKNCGGVACQKTRFEVLDRVRAVAQLSPDQMSEWQFFKQSWDTLMADTHGDNWAMLFAEMIQNVLKELEAGRTNALSEFMNSESQRVLRDVQALVVPGS